MKKILLLVAFAVSMTACSSLKSMDKEHKAARKELRVEQKAKKKALGEEHKAEAKIIGDEHKAEANKLKIRLKKERELLQAKQAIEFAVYGTQKYKELETLIKDLEAFLK